LSAVGVRDDGDPISPWEEDEDENWKEKRESKKGEDKIILELYNSNLVTKKYF
jgi:hypothetical protein